MATHILNSNDNETKSNLFLSYMNENCVVRALFKSYSYKQPATIVCSYSYIIYEHYTCMCSSMSPFFSFVIRAQKTHVTTWSSYISISLYDVFIYKQVWIIDFINKAMLFKCKWNRCLWILVLFLLFHCRLSHFDVSY